MTSDDRLNRLLPPPSRWPMFMALAAAILIFAVSVALIVTSRLDTATMRKQLRATQEDLALTKAELVGKELTLQSARARLAPLTDAVGAARLEIIDLSPPSATGSDVAARGRILWDKERDRWVVAAFGLAPAAEGRAYAVWLVTSEGPKVLAQTFNTGVAGDAIVTIEVPNGLGVSGVAITDEPAGGSSEPSGTTHLAGTVKM